MKKHLAVIDNVDVSKTLLEKSILLAPDELFVLVVDPKDQSKQEELQGSIESLIKKKSKQNIKLNIEVAKAINDDALTDLIIKHSEDLSAELVLIQKPRVTDDSKKIEFIKKLLRSLIKSKLFFSQGQPWKSEPDIMCALDIGEKDEAQRALDRRVYDVAQKIMPSNLPANLHLAGVIEISRINKELDIVDEDEVLAKKGNLYREKLLDFEKKASSEGAIIHVVAGLPAKKIPSLVKKKNIDVLVMGNVGRKGVKGFVLGNTAEEIMKYTKSDVLVINGLLI